MLSLRPVVGCTIGPRVHAGEWTVSPVVEGQYPAGWLAAYKALDLVRGALFFTKTGSPSPGSKRALLDLPRQALAACRREQDPLTDTRG